MAIVIQEALTEAVFIERRNRFVAVVEIGGRRQEAHVANTGRMKELLIAGARVLLKPGGGAPRKTQFTLYMVMKDGIWVVLDSIAANVLVYQALQEKKLPMFSNYHTARREVSYGHSRFDAGVFGKDTVCYIEVKCCTLVVDGEARFPDAPTERGRKHVEELSGAVKAGYGGAIIFVAQRPDGQAFCPNDATDPDFGQALRRAEQAGVKVLAFNCAVSPRHIALDREIPVFLR